MVLQWADLLLVSSSLTAGTIHCKENPILCIPFWELHRLSSKFLTHVSVSDLIFPGLVFLQQNRQTNPGNI